MENLRWILILAGVAILVLLYFTGRPKKKPRRPAVGLDSDFAELNGHYDKNADFDPLLGDQPSHDQYAAFDNVHPDDMLRPGETRGGGAGSADIYSDVGSPPADYPNMDRPGAGVRQAGSSQSRGDYEFDEIDQNDGRGASTVSGFSSFTQKFEAFSERLTPKRRQRIAESEPADLDDESSTNREYASKIVTLHVVAQPDSQLSGERLLEVFERRGYHFGDMNIFHSMHDGTTVFSVAKMIEPGFFDINDMSSFDTPGITLILQLPGPVPADVSFEVLINEAFEMANELGATVHDEQHSNLSKQTVQHLREGIYEYMHRQKYFGTVPS